MLLCLLGKPCSSIYSSLFDGFSINLAQCVLEVKNHVYPISYYLQILGGHASFLLIFVKPRAGLRSPPLLLLDTPLMTSHMCGA